MYKHQEVLHRAWTYLGWEREDPLSLLHRAVAAGDVAGVSQLLARGADPNTLVSLYVPGVSSYEDIDDWQGGSRRLRYSCVFPLDVVSMFSYDEATKQAIATTLITAGAWVNYPRRFQGLSALYTAAEHRDPVMVRLLLEQGANLFWHGYQDETVLYGAFCGWENPLAENGRSWRADKLKDVLQILFGRGSRSQRTTP